MTVQFNNVGRDKVSWSAQVKEVTEPALLREVKKKGVLMSRGVDVDFDASGLSGCIVVGGFRVVGHFIVVEGNNEPP